ncbi:MAG TPA: beta-hydroxyacyl-ACP dehydratase [Phycisphaerae bacterium]|nr:beta-hydroxyacyl-ACP dehydratase [Phycisphaerae bacterium]
MPPPFLLDLSSIDLSKTILDLNAIRAIIPQRFEMEMLSGIVFENETNIIGYKDITLDDFWVRGHIPGRPLMPGVLMIECAAQLCAFWTMRRQPEMGFVGFARCDDVIFRGTVVPPTRLYMISQMVEVTRRRAIGKCQGIHNGSLVFEATITGMSV